ncbi:MAG: NifB/NifX family molybdenum-iron cluster-binding protein [Candidatus Heimdallarchaeota archaeon]|nr:NifB/NifX family molybdenum-iron cluster-binding protein [Candidatus Heimdallarchaeota archaeon]
MTTIAFPISNANSRDDKAYGHFGKAKSFYVVKDINDPSKDEIIANESDHFGGTLSPPDFLKETVSIDAICTIGMGMKAIAKFQSHNIAVYQIDDEPISIVLEKYRNQELTEMTEGCSHHHQ